MCSVLTVIVARANLSFLGDIIIGHTVAVGHSSSSCGFITCYHSVVIFSTLTFTNFSIAVEPCWTGAVILTCVAVKFSSVVTISLTSFITIADAMEVKLHVSRMKITLHLIAVEYII